MPNEDKLKTLHTNLTNKVDGFEVDYETFKKDMQDDVKRKTLHANMPKYFEGFEVDYDTFSNDMGVKKKVSSQNFGKDYQNISEAVSKTGSVLALEGELVDGKLSSMPSWAKEKLANKGNELLTKPKVVTQDYLAGYQKNLEAQIPNFLEEEKKKNERLVLSKPDEMEIIYSDVPDVFYDNSPEIRNQTSPDKSDISYWKNLTPDNAALGTRTTFGGKAIDMSLPMKKMVDDYLYYESKHNPDEFKKIADRELNDSEITDIVIKANQHQQEKIKAEYNLKNQGENALSIFGKHIASDWDWTKEDVQKSADLVNQITEDFLYGSDEGVAQKFREREKQAINKETEQKITDSKYEFYSKRGGIMADPLTGLYYNIVQPVGTRTQDFLRGITTLPRAVGLDELAPEVFGKIVADGEKLFSPTDTETPTKLKADLFGKDGFNFTALVPKLAGVLTDFGLLMVGTKGLGATGVASKPSLLASSFVSTNDNYFNEGIDAGLSKKQATAYADVAALATSLLELVSPNSNITSGFKSKITGQVLSDVAEGKAVKEAFDTRFSEFMKEIGKEELQEFSQLLADKGINFATNETLGSNLNTEISQNEIFETALLTFAVGGIANMNQLRPVNDKSLSALYTLSISDDTNREKIVRKGMEDGYITPEQGQNIIDKTNEMRSIIAGIPDKYNARQKMNMATLIYQEKLAESQEKEKIINPIFEEEQPKVREKLQEELKTVKETYDKANKQGEVSSPIGEGETTIEENPIEETGGETTGTGGMVQGTPETIEPIIEEIRPTEEAKSKEWDEKVIGKLDEWEKNLKDFGKGTLGINVPVVVGSGAIKAMKAVVKTAATVQDIIQAGIDHVKQSDWYLSMGQNDRNEVDDQLEHDFNINISERVPTSKEKQKQRETAEFYKGVSEGIKKGIEETTDTQKDLSTQIREVLKKPSIITKLSLPQYRALVNEARNVTTPEQLEAYKGKVAEILEKQNETNILKEKKTQANKSRKAIKKAARSKDTLGTDKGVFKAFASLNPNQVDDIDKYNDIASQLTETIKTKDRIYTNKEIEDYIVEQQKNINDNKRKEILSNETELVELGILKESMTLDEIESVLSEADEHITKSEKTSEKESLKERKKERESELKDKINKEIESISEMDFEGISEMEKETLKELNEIDVDKIPYKDLIKFYNVLTNITTNSSFIGAGLISNIHAAQYGTELIRDELKSLGEKDIDTYLDDFTGLFLRIARNIKLKMSSLPNLIKAMVVYKDLTTKVRVATQIQDLMSGHAKTVEAMETFNKGFNKVVTKENSTPYSQTKQAYYAQLNMATDEADFNRIKELIRQSSYNSAKDGLYEAKRKKQITSEQYDSLLELVEKQARDNENVLITSADLKANIPNGDFDDLVVYEEVIKNANTIEDISLNESEKSMLSFLEQEFAKVKNDYFTSAEMFGNVLLQDENNYLPTVYSTLLSESTPKTQETLEQQIQQEAFTDKLINKRTSGASIEKVRPAIIPKGRKISTNFQYDMMRKYREAQYQINTLKARNNILAVLDNPDFVKLFGVKNAELLKEQIAKVIKAQTNQLDSDPLAVELYSLGNRTSRFGASMVLGDWIFGYGKQYLPGFIGALTKLDKNVDLLFNSPARSARKGKRDNLFKYSNLQERVNTKAGFKTESYADEKEYEKMKNSTKKTIAKLTGLTGDALEKANNIMMSEISRGDTHLANRVWVAYYGEYRRKQTGKKDIDWDAETSNPDKLASAYADQQIEETMSTNSFSNLPDLLRRNRNLGDIFKNIIFPFSTFTVNQRVRLSNAVKTARKAKGKEQADAWQEIGAIVGESMAFTNINIGIQALRGLVVYEILLAFGYDDEEAKMMAGEIDFERVVKQNAGNLAKDLFITGMGSQVETTGAYGLNMLYKLVSGDDKDIIYAPNNADFNLSYYMGTYGIVGDRVWKLISDLDNRFGTFDATKGGFKGKEEYFDKEITDKEKNIYSMLIINDLISLSGFNQQQVNSTMDKIRRGVEKNMLYKYGGGESTIIRGGKDFKKEENNRRSKNRTNTRSRSSR